MAELFGAWSQLFGTVVGYAALPHEKTEDIVAGGWILGQHRTGLLIGRRPFEIWQDVPYGLSIFCWWPLKPSLYDDSCFTNLSS